MTIPDSKNGDHRAVPLDDELRAIIEERWQAREYVQIGGVIGVSE